MSDAAAEAFVHSQRILLDAEIRQETSVHLQTPLQLCGIALGHGLRASARELCNQTWELTTGYGHRKDPTLNNTVDAIDYLVEVAADDARRLLSLISPQIHHVLDYTDGKGTRHVLAAADHLLAKLCPRPWSSSTRSTRTRAIGRMQRTACGHTWSRLSGTAGRWMRSCERVCTEIQDALARLEHAGQEGAAERLRVLKEHAGWDVGVLQRTDAPSDSDGKPYTGDIAVYAPEQLDDLLASLSTTSYDEEKSCFEPGMSTGIELGRADVCSPRWTDCCSQTKGAARASSNCLTLLLRPGAN